jgi:hypothetical protein
MTYLEAALTRAMDPSVVAPREVIATPHFAGPAPSVVRSERAVPMRAVLDPYSVAAKGETYLRQQLARYTHSVSEILRVTTTSRTPPLIWRRSHNQSSSS